MSVTPLWPKMPCCLAASDTCLTTGKQAALQYCACHCIPAEPQASKKLQVLSTPYLLQCVHTPSSMLPFLDWHCNAWHEQHNDVRAYQPHLTQVVMGC